MGCSSGAWAALLGVRSVLASPPHPAGCEHRERNRPAALEPQDRLEARRPVIHLSTQTADRARSAATGCVDGVLTIMCLVFGRPVLVD